MTPQQGHSIFFFFQITGEHYWYNVTSEMSCDDFWPMFILYNSMLLAGPFRAITTAPDMNTRPLMILGYVEIDRACMLQLSFFETQAELANLAILHNFAAKFAKFGKFCQN